MSVKEGKQDYGIQPFQIQDDESVVEFLQRTTWFEAMTKALQKHSEFMQPQSDSGDYPNMEYSYPDYTNPNDTLPADGAEGNINPRGGVCVLSCFAPLYCYEPVECHFSISQTPTGMNPAEAAAHWQMEARETNPTTSPPLREQLVSGDRLSIVSHQSHAEMDKLIRDQNIGLPTQVMERKRTEGVAAVRDNIFMMRISPPSGDWPHWPEDQSTLLYVRAMDAAGNLCDTKVSVFCRVEDCCTSDGYVAMTFDDASTADTIAQSSSITVYVQDGCGPYDWSVSGTGFSFASAATSGVSNTLTASGSACGTATITVTDSCGTSVTARVRCTTGTWTDVETICGVAQSYSTQCFGDVKSNYIRYKLEMKAAVGTPCNGGVGYECCEVARSGASGYGFDGSPVGSDCGAFCGSDFGLGAPHTNVCFNWLGTQSWVTWLTKQEWRCA